MDPDRWSAANESISDPDLNRLEQGQERDRCRLHKSSIRIRAAVRMRPPMIPTRMMASGRDSEIRHSPFLDTKA